MIQDGGKFCMRQSDNFGFPCRIQNIPEGCIQIGTVILKIMHGEIYPSNGIEVNVEGATWLTVIEKGNPLPRNEQTYLRPDGTGKRPVSGEVTCSARMFIMANTVLVIATPAVMMLWMP